MFENGCNTSYFKKWMASSGMVFYFTYYGDKGIWKALVKRALECDMSWGKSANEYIKMYKALMKE